MPELPEVETVVKIIREYGIINSFISEVIIKKENHIKEIEIKKFINILIGERIIEIERKGKWIFFILDKWILINHLRMSGKYFFSERKFSLSINFSNGKKLFYCDQRGFGVFYLQKKELFKSLSPYNKIGPDFIKEDIKLSYLFSSLKKINVPIKTALLEQKIVSGIGNIYASEILFECKINPFRKTRDITIKEVEKIIFYSKKILKKSIEMNGTSIFDFISPLEKMGSYQKKLKVYMKKGMPCYECKNFILMKKINNRNSFFCSFCQK